MRAPSRIQIQQVWPTLDGGRYPVKRTVGEELRVAATVFADGHDIVRVALRVRPTGARRWTEIELHPLGNDRFEAEFTPDAIGRWQYSVVAWIDRWGSWRRELERKVDAGQSDFASELLEGAMLAGIAVTKGGVPDLTLEEGLDPGFDPGLPREGETALAKPLDLVVDPELARVGAWYELFPRSWGGLKGVERALPQLAELGFDVLYLPPIHPIGSTHRKGRNNALAAGPGDPGSPWAIGAPEGGHTAVHPELGTMADLESLAGAARKLGIEIALDFAIQCSPDHPWLAEHPEWFHRRPDGTLKYAENPPKKYQDIYNVNFQCDDWEALWGALRDVVLFWVGKGVRVFRVDNPHTKPVFFWEWLIAQVHAAHPEVIFLAEAFTRPAMMATLAKIGFNQSYTYFTWKNTKAELTEYIDQLASGELAECYRPNFFANTPDILHEYLQQGGRPAFEARLVLAATLSPTYGIYSGYEHCENVPVKAGSEEYLDSEKYEVKERSLDGGILPLVKRINEIRRGSPALRQLRDITFLETGNEHLIAYAKRAAGETIVTCVNLDPRGPQEGFCELPWFLGLPHAFGVRDLLDGAAYTWVTGRNYLRLGPGQMAHVLRVEAAATPAVSGAAAGTGAA